MRYDHNARRRGILIGALAAKLQGCDPGINNSTAEGLARSLYFHFLEIEDERNRRESTGHPWVGGPNSTAGSMQYAITGAFASAGFTGDKHVMLATEYADEFTNLLREAQMGYPLD